MAGPFERLYMRIFLIALLISVSVTGCAGLTARTPIYNDSGQVIAYEPSILDEILSAGRAKAEETGVVTDALTGDWLGLALGGAATILAGGGAGVAAYRRKKKKEAEEAGV